jgi:hypothetical protein
MYVLFYDGGPLGSYDFVYMYTLNCRSVRLVSRIIASCTCRTERIVLQGGVGQWPPTC